MVPNPIALYDDDVRARTRWSIREGLIVSSILLFWAGVAAVLTVVLLVITLPFTLFSIGRPGIPLVGLIWTLVGPLAFSNVLLYVLVRAGTVIVDHYRSDGGTTFDEFVGAERRSGRARATDEVASADVAETEPDGDAAVE